MNKKPLDSLLEFQKYNQTLFKQSVSIVQNTKNIIPISKIPIQLIKPKTSVDLKKKQQTLETQLSKSIKLFGQILAVNKNTFGTINDYATDIFQELTDLIESSCQSFLQKKKKVKNLQKRQQETKEKGQVIPLINTILNNQNRPQQVYPLIKYSQFDHHHHAFPSVQNLRLKCDSIQFSSSLTSGYSYISTKIELQKMISQLIQCRQIAVDLQHSSKSYQGFTCLIQISSRTRDYIVDVFPLWQHIHQLKTLIQNESIIKVMHGAEMDVKWFQRDFNIHIANLFDTYKASRVLGYPKFSYAYLLHHYCDTVTDKRYQLADWRQRPLSPEMLHYARVDTHYLLQIWDKLTQDLIKQSLSMNLEPQSTILQIYKSSYEVTLNQVQLFSYQKKEIYQNLKNDTKPQNFQIIETVFWTIDKIAKQEDQAFDDLISKRTFLDIIGRVKDLLQNRRAAIDMLRVKIDRLIGVIKSHKHEKVGLLLSPIKKVLQAFFLQPKKDVQMSSKKKNKFINETHLIERIQQQQRKLQAKENIDSFKSQIFINEKPSVTIEQMDYPLKTYENFSLQQGINNKTNVFGLVKFEPIMTFLSKQFSINQKQQEEPSEHSEVDRDFNEEMELEQEIKDEQNNDNGQNEGFLQFKRIKPNVIYTVEEQQIPSDAAKLGKKKRKEMQYEKKLKNKEGNIYDLLQVDE